MTSQHNGADSSARTVIPPQPIATAMSRRVRGIQGGRTTGFEVMIDGPIAVVTKKVNARKDRVVRKFLCMGGRSVGPAVAGDLAHIFLAVEFRPAERPLQRLSGSGHG